MLKIIYQHNFFKYDEEEKEYENLSRKSAVKYVAKLKEYGIEQDVFQISNIMKNSLEDVEKILIILDKLNIEDKSVMISILQNTNISTIESIYNLVTQGIIKKALINDNPTILDDTSVSYNNLMTNLSTLEEENINKLNFVNSKDLLLIDNDLFKKNIDILKDYDLVGSIKSTNNYSFIKNNQLDALIDKVLELGYESYLERNLGLLNFDSNKWMRINLLKQMDTDISSEKDLIEYLHMDKFFVDDNLLDNYIYNRVDSSNDISSNRNVCEEVEELSEYKLTSRVYSINNVLISKNKVKRQYIDEKHLLESITYGSILTDLEYENVKTALKVKVYM